MKTVFVSSVQRDYADVRDQAAAAIESLGMAVLRAARAGASPRSPLDALLDEVRQADLLLLLVGPRYGDRGQRGFSPTEDEYREAEQSGIPAIALVQDTERDADQEEFLARLRGSWEDERTVQEIFSSGYVAEVPRLCDSGPGAAPPDAYAP